MSFNATRLTCFALISAIESDCRNLILALPSEARWPEACETAAKSRYERERGTWNGTNYTLLVDFLDFADSYQILLSHKVHLQESLQASLSAVSERLQEVTGIRNRVAHTRPMEINDFSTLQDVADALLAGSRTHWHDLTETMNRLQQDPAYVLGLTIQLPGDPIKQPYHDLSFPDFDETGFYGRKNELKRIKQALRGAWPVVSILGDGGIGKTSIALKAAYEILDDKNFDFEAVVWVSAKATTLTTSEIQNISGAIQDSLGLFKAAAVELGIPTTSMDDASAEVLQYLETFKVLLVLDNLETVSDQRLRDFLLNLPTGSKVLITSRIGLGIESPIKLEPLKDEESRRLLRAFAAIRNVELLKSLDNDGIDKFIGRLNGHPLYIKWLVSGVEAGKHPSELFNNNTLLLDFCMSNVFDKLSEPARGVLQAMQVVQGQRSQAELAFLTELSAYEIQETLLELLTTNFVAMKRSGYDEFEGIYQTGEFARQYLAKNRPIQSQFRNRIAERARELTRLGQTLKASSFTSRYDSRSIDIRGPHDIPAAKLLVETQRLIKLGSIDEALALCHEAQKLSPSYYEAWRVEALVHSHRQDLYAATEAFETALTLAGDSPLVAYHFGNYLLDDVADPGKALGALQIAARLDPHGEEVLFSLARAHFLMGNYSECLDTCVGIQGRGIRLLSPKVLITLLLRAAVFGVEAKLWEGHLGDALDLIDALLSTIRDVDPGVMPAGTVDWLIRLRDNADRIAIEGESDDYVTKRAASMRHQLALRLEAQDKDFASRNVGLVVKLDSDRHFGFIQTGKGDYFFHHNNLIVRSQWNDVDTNRLAAFSIDRGTGKGPRAVSVRVLS